MIDLTKTIEAKSDQLNADDIVGITKDLKVTAVSVTNTDQPVSIRYEGDNGKPYKPCKAMRRILMCAWGKDGEAYVGKTIRVYNDKTVKWAGIEVGGIRISHLSDVEDTFRMAIAVAKGKRIPVEIHPLVVGAEPMKARELTAWKDDMEKEGLFELVSAEDLATLKKDRVKTFSEELKAKAQKKKDEMPIEEVEPDAEEVDAPTEEVKE